MISEERDQEDWIVSDTFGIITPCSASHQSFFWSEKNSETLNFEATFPKEKRSSATKKKEKFI